MNVHEFLEARSRKFTEHLLSRGVDLPEKYDLRCTARSLGGNLLALDSDPPSEPEINGQEMSARFIVSTPRKDRAGDVVIPRGCLPHLDSYRRNPVSFFSHKSTDFPIGALRKDANSPLEFDVGEDLIRAKIYFHGMTAESELVFKLVNAGILRATSIGFIPHVAALINEDDDPDLDDKNGLGEHLIYFGEEKAKRFPGLRFHSWELTEVSVVPLPMNPEALQCSLSRGHIEGQVLTPSIRKALEPYALPQKVWSPGALLEQIPEPPNPETPLVIDTPVPEPTPSPEEKSLEGMPSPAPTDPYAGWSHGAKFLDSLSKLLGDLHCYMDQECALLDQPRVKRYATRKMDKVLRDVHKVKKLGSALYPEKFEDPGEIQEKGLVPDPVPIPEVPVVEKNLEPEPTPEPEPEPDQVGKSVAVALPISEAVHYSSILQELESLNERFNRIDEKFYSLTGRE